MSVCVIGAGFIGSNLAKKLSKKNIVYLLSKKRIDVKLKNVSTIKANYTKSFFLKFFKSKNIKKIFFFSGVPHPNFCQSYEKKIFKVETQVLINLFDSLIKTNFNGNFFLSSTCSVYGNRRIPVAEKNKIDPQTLYSIIKTLSEKIAIFFSKLSNFKLTIIRISSVYGYGLKRQVIYDLFNKFSKKKKNIFITGSGYEKRDFINIFYLINGIYLISKFETKKKNSFEIYNLGSGEIVNIKKISKLIKILIKSKSKINFTRKKNMSNYFSIHPDISKIKTINFKPTYDIAKGLKEMFVKLNFANKNIKIY